MFFGDIYLLIFTKLESLLFQYIIYQMIYFENIDES